MLVFESVESSFSIEFFDPLGIAEFITVENRLARAKQLRGLFLHPRGRVALDYNVSDVAVDDKSDVMLVCGEPVSEDSKPLNDGIVSRADVIDKFKPESSEGVSGN